MLRKKKRVLESELHEFECSLLEIKDLADKLDYPNFSRMFNLGLTILKEDLSEHDKAKRVVAATCVFGGMGSWNDSPPYSAHQLDMEKEFEEITSTFYEKREQLIKRMS
ncbi:hypothetical protein [Isobaculum melis]|uniref:Uncharacterized protein n=1 Tax=Isobaculum melis TaxID=142588 RepID=A0A1H9U5G8_9LACT|nr:hypothetical protein [Isobaculum melis]SES04478.1 hypothetical protein SAMN04488559_12149 [Isobaculum melis]